jgi:hypothetical protein
MSFFFLSGIRRECGPCLLLIVIIGPRPPSVCVVVLRVDRPPGLGPEGHLRLIGVEEGLGERAPPVDG